MKVRVPRHDLRVPALTRPPRSRGRSATRSAALVILAVGLVTVLASGSVAAASASDVPVLGTTTITPGRSSDATPVVVLVHGVRRVPQGTVLYYSVGAAKGTNTPNVAALIETSLRWRHSISGPLMANAMLVDGAGGNAYTVLIDDHKHALASPDKALNDAEPGQFCVLYQVMPALPAGTKTVDIVLGHGDVVPNVPVSDGAMEPAVDQTGPIVLGRGWPRIGPATVAASMEPEKAVVPLQYVTSDIEKTTVTREKSNQVSVDLSADVLFAVDSATLTPAAKAKIQAAATAVNQRAQAGVVLVAGHTDSTGDAAHNDDLSLRRAQAVQAVLRPLITAPGVTLKVEGHGEREPVASNNTEDGRQANRRVSVVFTTKGAGQ
jgi:OOP family OmpA-OmpF porin